jgi:hypothetical protein
MGVSSYRKHFWSALMAALMLSGTAIYAADEQHAEKQASAAALRGDGKTSGALYVPVYPGMKRKEASVQPDAPLMQSLGNSYILLEDGSALSMADWILAGLDRNQVGADMSDYESRLFLGQVARAMVGESEDLTHQSLVYTAPTVRYQTPPPPKGMEALWKNAVGLVASVILPGTPEGWSPTNTGGGFSPVMTTGDGAAILFQGQFYEAIMHTAGDFKEQGTYQSMLKAAGRNLSEQTHKGDSDKE